MRKAYWENNKLCYRDATAEEIAELERQAQELPPPEPTMGERVAELEEALELLLSGVTE